MLYDVSSTFFCRETGAKYEAGSAAELPDEVALSYNANHPGLLKPRRHTAQAHAETVRSEPKRRGRTPRARR